MTERRGYFRSVESGPLESVEGASCLGWRGGSLWRAERRLVEELELKKVRRAMWERWVEFILRLSFPFGGGFEVLDELGHIVIVVVVGLLLALLLLLGEVLEVRVVLGAHLVDNVGQQLLNLLRLGSADHHRHALANRHIHCCPQPLRAYRSACRSASPCYRL